jgi:hypothetical protein
MPCTTNRSKKIKNKWRPDEDQQLHALVDQYGTNWNKIASFFPDRNARQCRNRWNNYVNPILDFSPLTPKEKALLAQKVTEFTTGIGIGWHKIASFFRNRSDAYLRNIHLRNIYLRKIHLRNIYLRKKQQKQGQRLITVPQQSEQEQHEQPMQQGQQQSTSATPPASAIQSGLTTDEFDLLIDPDYISHNHDDEFFF